MRACLAVARRRQVGVRTQAKQHFTGVVNIHVVVRHDDVFGPAVAGSSAPCPRGRALVAVRKDFVGLHRVGLLDAHEDEVVEDAFRRQRPAGAGSTISRKFILKMSAEREDAWEFS